MMKKIKVVFGLILASFMLIGTFGIVSAITCTPESYDSGWLNIGDYVYEYSGDAAIYGGSWYIDSSTGIVTIETPSLNFAETYDFYFKYGIGTGNDIDTEDFQVICGGQTFDFPDEILIDDPQTLTKSVSCNLNEGVNYIEFISTNTGSVHLYEFKLIGEKTCPPLEPICGNSVQEIGEECDDGNTQSGDGCSSTCQIEEDEEDEEDEDDKSNRKANIMEPCNPNWQCSGWTDCYDGVMMRNCVDSNHCEVEYNKPNEITACEIQEQAKEPVSSNNLFWFFFGIILLILLLIILVNLMR